MWGEARKTLQLEWDVLRELVFGTAWAVAVYTITVGVCAFLKCSFVALDV